MTSGTKTVDNRYSMNCNSSSSCYSPGTTVTSVFGFGRRITKTWSGGNSPSTAVKPWKLVTYSYRVWRKDGSSYVRKARTKVFVQGVRPPKTENNYTMTLDDKTEYKYTEIQPNACPSTKKIMYYEGCTSALPGSIDMASVMWSTSDDAALIGKLSNRLQGESFNMAVFLGEGREALNTIATSATRIYKSFKKLRKGRPKAALDELLTGSSRRTRERPIDRRTVTDEWLAGKWLEYSYAWKPLVQDAYGAAAHFAYMQSKDQTITYRVRVKKPEIPVISASSSFKVHGSALMGKTLKAKITRIDQTGLLGLKDPASFAWELLPFSFVADWFLPIGDYLERVNFSRSLTGTYVTSRYYKNTVTGATWILNKNSVIDATFSRIHIETGRSVSTSLNVPKPSITPWSELNSWRKAATSIALLATFSGSKVRESGWILNPAP